MKSLQEPNERKFKEATEADFEDVDMIDLREDSTKKLKEPS